LKKIYCFAYLLLAALTTQAQTSFPGIVEPDKLGATAPTTVIVPASPLKTQVLFVGGVDDVAHKALAAKVGGTGTIYGEAAGLSKAKEWHDFIGFTPATETEIRAMANKGHLNFMGWVSVNHEMLWNDNKVGDGGGMSVFAVKRDAATDSLIIVPQDLSAEGFPDGTHNFFNVDFAGTVGETGMNCGGIVSAKDGRIWTAEEWFSSNQASIWTGNNAPYLGAGPGTGVRDTLDFTIHASEFTGADFNGTTIKKFQNFNWMVEIDPRKSKAIRKQYNWGRQGFESGTVMPDDKTVYLGEDNSPALFTKFVADVAGDFTKGKTYVYKWDHDTNPDNNWIEIDNTKLDSMMNIRTYAFQKGASAFCRIEWVTFNKNTGKVYFTETGNDNWAPTGRPNLTIAKHMIEFYRTRSAEMGLNHSSYTDAQIADSLKAGRFRLRDFYGRVTEYDPATGVVRTFLKGGPYFATSPTAANYPAKHLSNPDGLGMFYTGGKTFMVIQEDLNGRTFGRVPSELVGNSAASLCEMFLLDMDIANPTFNDLFKISTTPLGAENTGACATPDGKALLFNSQHASTSNPAPFNHSVTLAITGWDKALAAGLNEKPKFIGRKFEVYPSPTSRELHLNRVMDAAIYNQGGVRVKVARNTNVMDISDLTPGTYVIMNEQNDSLKFNVQ
jgi:secreted PhoX family phosphatase